MSRPSSSARTMKKLDHEIVLCAVDGAANRVEGFGTIDEEPGLVVESHRKMGEPLGEARGIPVFFGEIGLVRLECRPRLGKYPGQRGIVRMAGQLVSAESGSAEHGEKRNGDIRKEHQSHRPADGCLGRAGDEDGLEGAENAADVEEYREAAIRRSNTIAPQFERNFHG